MPVQTLIRRTAIATLALLGAAGSAGAVVERAPPGSQTFRSTEAISYQLGSKRAVGFFEQIDGKCRVTLMIAEIIDLDHMRPLTAARLKMSLLPGQSAALDSAERESMVLTCGSEARTMEVKRSSPVRS